MYVGIHLHSGFTFYSVGCRIFLGLLRYVLLLRCCFVWSQESCYSTMGTDGSSSAPPRHEVVSGLARQNNFVPSRRFREGGREAPKLATGGGGARINTLGAPAVAKHTKPGDPLLVDVEPVVHIFCLKKTKHSDSGSHTLNAQAPKKNVCDFSWPNYTTRGVCVFTWFWYVTLFWLKWNRCALFWDLLSRKYIDQKQGSPRCERLKAWLPLHSYYIYGSDVGI